MKLGSIVRRKTKNGAPIGPYMVVVSINGERILTSVIRSKAPIQMYIKNNLYVYKCKSLYISKEKLELLKKGIDICVQHPDTPHWQRVFDKQPELIRFVERQTEDYAIFIPEYIKDIYSFGERNIRIVVSSRVL